MRTLSWLLVIAACGGSSAPPVIPADLPATTKPTKPMPDPTSTTSPTHPWPATRADAIVETLHGKTVADPYRWLEDEHSPEVQAWMKAQDDVTRAALGTLPGRAALVARLKALLYYDAISAPTHKQGRFFYTRKHADKEKTIVYWKQGETGAEKG